MLQYTAMYSEFSCYPSYAYVMATKSSQTSTVFTIQVAPLAFSSVSKFTTPGSNKLRRPMAQLR